MTEEVKIIAEWSAAIVEIIGIAVIVLAAIVGPLSAVFEKKSQAAGHDLLMKVRRRLGHGILVGLEFLVAADIIHTVAVDFDLHTVGVLAIIVLIRTFLSFTMELELTGSWPWAKNSPRS